MFRLFKRGRSVSAEALESAPGVTVRIHGDGAVFLHPSKGTIYSCNSIGAKIWTGLQEQRPLPEIAGNLAREYRVTAERTSRDAAQFIRELQEAGILIRQTSAAGL